MVSYLVVIILGKRITYFSKAHKNKLNLTQQIIESRQFLSPFCIIRKKWVDDMVQLLLKTFITGRMSFMFG